MISGNDYVRTFVEEYIDLMENNDWENVFNHWYRDARENTLVFQESFTDELLHVIEDVGFDNSLVYEGRRKCMKFQLELATEIARQRVIKHNSDKIPFISIIAPLETHLGFTISELGDMLYDIKIPGLVTKRSYGYFKIIK